jgi:hypothetical protein
MHDWTPVSILFEWKSGCVTLEFRTEGSNSAKLTAHGVCELHAARLNDWGPSVSVNRVFGRPMELRGGASSKSKCNRATASGS